MPNHLLALALATTLALAAPSCGGSDFDTGSGGSSPGPTDKEVGAACSADAECASKCLVHGDFGAGMCSRVCAAAGDCPTGASCVQVGTGMCAVACATDTDCAGYRDGWVCGEEDAVGGGVAHVCRIP